MSINKKCSRPGRYNIAQYIAILYLELKRAGVGEERFHMKGFRVRAWSLGSGFRVRVKGFGQVFRIRV